MTGLASCRVCGSGNSHFLCRNRNEHGPIVWLDSFRCADCGCVFIGNPIGDAELAGAYATLNSPAYYRETSDASAAKFEQAARDVAGLVAPTADILDIGGGDGSFLRALKARGFSRLALHEIAGAALPDLSDTVRAIYRDDDYASLPVAAFDVVTLMDVMEHVPRPGAVLSAARRALRRGGLLYVHTPQVTALDRLMHVVQRVPGIGRAGSVWQRARTSIFHLQIYTPRALRCLARRSGFAVLRLDTINELSWPVERYVRVYLSDKARLPAALVRPVARFLEPLLRSRLNANKAVLVARVSNV